MGACKKFLSAKDKANQTSVSIANIRPKFIKKSNRINMILRYETLLTENESHSCKCKYFIGGKD